MINNKMAVTKVVTVSEGEATMEATKVIAIEEEAIEGDYMEPMNEEGVYTEDGMFAETGVAQMKDPLLSSWPFVIGISALVLCASVALGVFLAKRKIKKGIELYED